MENRSYKALVVVEGRDGHFSRSIKTRYIDDLPEHNVMIRVQYSSLNYKDALSATGNKGVTKAYPHTPGIDAAGTVVESSDQRFRPHQKVIVTSFDLGQNTPGGFGQYIRVPGDWIVPLPESLSLRESMILGTAGFTAAYGVYKIIHNHIKPEDGRVLVTGATGGVGSLAVSLLAQQGFHVTAATGKMDQQNYLKKLGANAVLHRNELSSEVNKPLLSSTWAAAFDTVGGSVLDIIIRQTKHNGTVVCCGNILGDEVRTSIYPFILRGVSLMGIDSGICLMPMRKEIWNLLATEWKPKYLEKIVHECTLMELSAEIDKTISGNQTGRVLVKL